MKSKRTLILAVVLVGTMLRLHQIGYNFDGDELFSVRAAGGSFSHMVTVSMEDRTHPPLHNFLLWCWMKIWGSSETSARMLSVLASVFFLLLVAAIAERWMVEWPAMFVVAVCAVSPFFVYYGQQARPYSLIALFSGLTVFLLLKAHEEPWRKSWEIAYGFACVGLLYTQYIGVLLLLPQVTACAFSKPVKRRGLLAWGIAGMLSITLWLMVVGRSLAPGQGKIQANIGWIAKPTLFSIFSYFVSIFGWLPFHGSARILFLLAFIFLLPLAFKYRSVDRARLLLIVALAALGPAALFAFSISGPMSIWATRQMIGSAIFLVCLMGLGLGLHRRAVGAALGVALLGWCALGVRDAFPIYAKPPWRSIAKIVDEEWPKYDVVAAENWISFPLGHYASTKVSELPAYSDRIGRAQGIIFLCRPARCETMGSFSPFYQATRELTVTWSLQPPSDTEKIDIYKLNRVTLPPQSGP